MPKASVGMHYAIKTLFFALLVGALFSPGNAHAHGELPYGANIFVDASGTLLGGATSYGLVFVESEQNIWTSDEILGSRLPDWTYRASDGRILSGTFFGIFETSDNGCSWRPQTTGPLVDRYVNILVRHPNDPDHLFVTTSTGQQSNGVYESVDGGKTWTATGLVDQALFFQALLIGPDGQDLWVKARDQEDADSNLLFHSNDGGQTWTEPKPDLSAYPTPPTLVGISEDGATLYLGTSRRPGFAELLISRDGLVSVETLATFGGGDTIDAVVEFSGWRYVIVDSDASFRDQQDGNWEQFFGGPTRCFEPHIQPGVLWACSQSRERFNFMSTRDGENWEYHIRFLEICPRQCPEDTDGAVVNPIQWPTMEAFGVGDPACHRSADPDAGVPDATPTTTNPPSDSPTNADDGCACRAVSTRHDRTLWIWSLLAIGAGIILRRRSRR